jgi:DNA polymerase III epsilon subunit-like protein
MEINPVVLDIETSGLDKVNCGIWQIGAIDLNDAGESFLQDARIDDEDSVEEGALEVIGKSESDLRDSKKQSQMQLLSNFFSWMGKRKVRNLLCQNPQFDLAFIEIRAKKYGLRKNFQHRAFDLHSIAQARYFGIHGKFFMKRNNDSRLESDMGLTNVLGMCGIEDNRLVFSDGKGMVKTGKPHNALDDCKLTGECFFRIFHGKNLFEEFSQLKMPPYLEVGMGK